MVIAGDYYLSGMGIVSPSCGFDAVEADAGNWSSAAGIEVEGLLSHPSRMPREMDGAQKWVGRLGRLLLPTHGGQEFWQPNGCSCFEVGNAGEANVSAGFFDDGFGDSET